MTRFMIMLTAAAICGPLAANAAAMPAANSATAAQLAKLSAQVLALNNEVQNLGPQFTTGTGYTAELAGAIPSGG